MSFSLLMPLLTQMLHIMSSQQIKTSQIHYKGNVGYDGWHVHLFVKVEYQVEEGEVKSMTRPPSYFLSAVHLSSNAHLAFMGFIFIVSIHLHL